MPPLPTADAETVEQTYNTWEAVLAFLDTPTSDGRQLASDGMTVRPLPLTLAFMPQTDDGHDGSYPVGRIDEVYVDGSKLMGRGVVDSSPEAQEAFRMVADRIQYEISIDPTVQEYAMRFPLDYDEEAIITEEGEPAIEVTENVSDYLVTFTKWELAGATIVNGAAFGETEISVTGDSTVDEMMSRPVWFDGSEIVANGTVAAGDPDDDEENGPAAMIAFYPSSDEAAAIANDPGDPNAAAADTLHCTLCVFTEAPDAELLDALLTDFATTQPPLAGDITGVGLFVGGDQYGTPEIALVDVLGLADLRTDLADTLEAAQLPYATDHDFVPHITLGYVPSGEPATVSGDDPAMSLPVTFAALSLVLADGTRTDYPLTGEGDMDEAVTAAAVGRAPEHPPSEWFEDPQLSEPTPMTYDDDGRVYGHAALFGVCHTGINGRCMTLDRLRSAADHAYFHTGYIVTSDGLKLRVGQVTIGTEHPSTLGRMDAQEVAKHYANTGSCAADVCVGTDEHGLWVAGAIRPDFPASRLRELRGSVLSGDWRPIRGHSELMALLAVNVPGFPVVAPEALVASGDEVLAAIAIGLNLPQTDEVDIDHRLSALRAAMDGLPGLREAAGLPA